MLSRDECALRLEQILSVLHVQHRVARIAALVTGRKINRQFSAFIDVLEATGPLRASAILEPEDAAKGRAKGVPHFPHQRCISR